jgi:hypothetical protein
MRSKSKHRVPSTVGSSFIHYARGENRLRKITNSVFLVIMLGFPLQILATEAQDATAARKHEICRGQLEEYVEARFHQTVSRISFDLFATDFDCDARAHLLTVPNYVFYRTSEFGC